MSRAALLALDIGVLALCVLAGRRGAWELFVDLPGVHVARWNLPWSVPGVCAGVILLASLVSGLAALGLLLGGRWVEDRGLWRAVELGGVAVFVVAFVVWTMDFISNAGQFG